MSPVAPRSTPAQGGPPASLNGFPTISPSSINACWHREHGHRSREPDGGCWYYAPLPADPTKGGRFDVPSPEGTCYFADTPRAAAMERVGRFTAQRKPVPADIVAGRVVSEVHASDLPSSAADLLAPHAASGFGVTGELFTMSDYSVPQAWAQSIRNALHEALIYIPRFSPGARAIAAFGTQRSKTAITNGLRTLAEILEDAGIDVAPIPPASALTFAAPPP